MEYRTAGILHIYREHLEIGVLNGGYPSYSQGAPRDWSIEWRVSFIFTGSTSRLEYRMAGILHIYREHLKGEKASGDELIERHRIDLLLKNI